MASKTAKIGTSVVAGGSSLMLIFNLIGSRIEDLNGKIESTYQEVHKYVDLRHDGVMSEIGHVREDQREMKEILKTIERRMYDQRHSKKGE